MRRTPYALCALAAALLLTLPATASAQKKFITIASAQPGGSWYITGAGWAEFLNKYIPGIEAKVEQSGGGLQNNKLVSDGKAEFAPSVARLVVLAMNAQGPFKEKLPNIRVLVSNWTYGVLQFATLEKSGLKSICDLKGKRITMGPAGGGGIPAALAAFKACGFSQADVTASFMSYEQGKEALLDGNLDAFLSYAAVPVPALKALEATPGARWRLLSLPEDKIQGIAKANPGYVRYVIPAKAYAFQPDAVPAVSLGAMLVANKSMSDRDAYNIAKAMVEHANEMQSVHPAMKALTPKFMTQQKSGEFHPGAAKLFKEKGLL